MHGKTEADRWWEVAACRQADPELFFPVSERGPARQQVARAKAVCATCTVTQPCLHYALATGQVHGIWGGLGEEERGRLAAVMAHSELSRTGSD